MVIFLIIVSIITLIIFWFQTRKASDSSQKIDRQKQEPEDENLIVKDIFIIPQSNASIIARVKNGTISEIKTIDIPYNSKTVGLKE